MRKPKSPILPPTNGISYLMDSTYLSNEKNGHWPETAELYIFMERWRGKHKQQRFVYEIAAPDEQSALDELIAIASRPDVRLIEERTRKAIAKEFLDDPHEQTELLGSGHIPKLPDVESES